MPPPPAQPTEDVGRVLRGSKKTISFHADVKAPGDDGDGADPSHPNVIPSPASKAGGGRDDNGAGVGVGAGAGAGAPAPGRLPPISQQPVRANRVFTPKGAVSAASANSADDANDPGGKAYLGNIPGPPVPASRGGARSPPRQDDGASEAGR